MSKLIYPCPFCAKGRPKADRTTLKPNGIGYFWVVYCPECGAYGPDAETRGKAIMAWNWRPQEDITRKVYEEEIFNLRDRVKEAEDAANESAQPYGSLSGTGRATLEQCEEAWGREILKGEKDG